MASKIYILFAGIVLGLAACKSKLDKAYLPFKKILEQAEYIAINDSIASNKTNTYFYVERIAIALKNNEEKLAWLDAKSAWQIKKNIGVANAICDVITAATYQPEFLTYAEAIVEAYPNELKTRRTLQLVLFNQKQFAAALKQNDTIFMQLKNKPFSNIGYLLQDRGKLLLELNDTSKAILNFEQAVAADPANQDAVYELANIYATSGNAKTINLCNNFILLDSANESPEPYYFKAVYYNAIKNNNLALEQINKANIIAYNFIDAWLLKGDILIGDQKYNEAEEAFNKALTISKINADAWYGLGQIAELKKDKQNAYLYYGRAFGFDNENLAAKDGMERNN